jgi:hypothetical protein
VGALHHRHRHNSATSIPDAVTAVAVSIPPSMRVPSTDRTTRPIVDSTLAVTSAHPTLAEPPPRRRYWRNAYVLARTGPAGWVR